MKVRGTIFDSESERRVFRSLETRWAKELALHPQLPLTKILKIEPAPDSTPHADWPFALKVLWNKLTLSA